MSSSRTEVMKHLEASAAEMIPTLTMSQDEYWQPTDLLPDMQDEDAFEQIRDLQSQSGGLSDDLLVVLIGDMLTEEALPSYSSWIAACDGFDRMGEPRNSWGEWLRKWTAEENRHGDVLNRFLYLTGRVNMREVEVTIQNLLADGGDVQTGTDPYKTFAYTSFQEIATRISHKNVAAQARKAGDEILGKLCAHIAADENRHAKAYKGFFAKVLEVDPDEAIIAFKDMMKSKITMPAMYMRERGMRLGETFERFEAVAKRQKIYTPADYTEIVEHLVASWNIPSVTGLGDQAAAAQDYLCTLADRYRKVAERFAEKVSDEVYRFSWLDTPETDAGAIVGSA